MITNYSYNNMKVMVNRVNQKNIKIIINDNYIKKYYIKIYDTNNNLIYEKINRKMSILIALFTILYPYLNILIL